MSLPSIGFRGSYRATLVVAVTGAIAVAAPGVGGGPPIELQKITVFDGQPSDQFGVSVAISCGRAVVGAWFEDQQGEDAGAAYVFEQSGDTWPQQAKLMADDGDAGDNFGGAVGMDGDVVVVGAIGDDDRGAFAGAAYVFRFDGANWVQEGKLTASDGAEGDRFGWSVSVSGDAAVVGARYEHREVGAAYVYRYDGKTWVEEQKLVGSDTGDFDRFGYSVAIAGNVVAVGARDHGALGSFSGAAYVFRFAGGKWTEDMKLLAEDGEQGDHFGASIAAGLNTVLVGASQEDERGPQAGAAYVFRYDGDSWSQEEKLLASDGDDGDRYGSAVAISGNAALVSSPIEAAGAVYIYRFLDNVWGEQDKITASDGTTDDNFGSDVSIHGDWVLIGAVYEDDRGAQAGAAYVGSATLCEADVDDNGIIDFTDLLRLLTDWGPCPGHPDPCQGDLDADCQIDFNDLLILLRDFRTECPK